MEDSYIDETLITSRLLEAFSIITLAGCIPVILILPIARCMPTGGLTRKIYRGFCDLHNVAYFDFYNLIDLMRSHKIDTGDLFVDGTHIDKSFAYAAGEVLASSFKILYERREKTPSRRKYTGFTHRFLSAELFQGSHDIVRRGTSLVSAVCVDFGPSVVSISVGDDEEIVAVVANFAYSKCCLELKGRNSITIRLSTDHHDSSNNSFTLGLWPLYPPIESWHSEVEMSVQNDRMSGVLCGEGPIVEGPGLASIIGFILRKPATLSVDPLFPHAVNLSRSFGEAFMATVPVMRLKVLHAAIVDGLYRGLLKRPVDRVGLARYANVISEQGFRKGIAESINSHYFGR